MLKQRLRKLLLLGAVGLLCSSAATAATLVQKNAFAYDIRVNRDNVLTPTVTYKLNGTASKVVIETYIDGVHQSALDKTGTTNDTNTVTMPSLVTLPSGNITYKVVVTTKTPVDAATAVSSNKYKFFCPFGVTVNNSTESNTFGNVVVSESRDVVQTNGSTSDAGAYHSSMKASTPGVSAGLYAFDGQMQPIKNSAGGYGFDGGWTVSVNDYGQFHRVKYSDDGRLFFGSQAASHFGLYEMNPDNLNQAPTEVITGNTAYYGICGFDVWGSGSNLKIATIESNAYNAGAAAANFTYKYFTLGNSKSIATGKQSSITGGNIFVYGTANVAIDPDGTGMIIGQYRANTTEFKYGHIPFQSTYSLNWTDDKTYFNSGAGIAWNKDRTLFAKATAEAPDDGQKTKIVIYSVSYTNKVPTFTEVYSFIPSTWGTSTKRAANMFAFDYANNLYVVSNSSEDVQCFQLPKSIALDANNATTVPAPSSQALAREVTTNKATNVKAVASGNTVTLTWTPGSVTNGEVNQQFIYWTNDGWKTSQTIEKLAANLSTYAFPGLADGDYAFMICTQGKQAKSVTDSGLDAVLSDKAYATVADTQLETKLSNQKWDGNKQTVKVSWNKLDITDTYNIYVNGTKVHTSTTTAKTLDIPMDKAAATTFKVVAVIGGAESTNPKHTATATTYHLPYGAMTMRAARRVAGEINDVRVSWEPLAQAGLVSDYEIWRAPVKTTITYNNDGKETKREYGEAGTFVKIATVSKELTNWFDGTASSTKEDAFAYKVIANMAVNLRIDEATTQNSITDGPSMADITKSYNEVNLTRAQVYPGRCTVELDWNAANPRPTYFLLYRNGALLCKLNSFCHIDSDVPVNNKETDRHQYQVVGIYTDDDTQTGTIVCSVRSNILEASGQITRDPAITRYGLEEIYNYTIANADEAASGQYENYVVGQGTLSNLKAKAGAWGAYGDTYRQGVYKNGYWYLAQLTDHPGENHVVKNEYISGMALSEYEQTHGSGVVALYAQTDENFKEHKAEGKRVLNVKGDLLNQAIAIDQDGHMFIRSANLDGSANSIVEDGSLSSASGDVYLRNKATNSTLFYMGLQRLSTANLTSNPLELAWVGSPYIKEPFYMTDLAFGKKSDGTLDYLSNGAITQINRVHYLSADNRAQDGGTRIFAALNRTGRVRVIDMKDGVCTGQHNYEIPSVVYKEDALGKKNHGVEQEDKMYDATNSSHTENYAYPIEGRDDFLHVIRSEGVYYVNAKTGKYTRVYEGNNASTAGGITFIYHGQLFVIDPVATRSNNSGHFRIDMTAAQWDAENNCIIDGGAADFDPKNMIPVVSFDQENMALWTAGNCNGNWFGIEPDEENDCVYIYQYVPGVRFAKYRFTNFDKFPGVDPALDVNINYRSGNKENIKNDNYNADAITHFDATFKWKRPNNYDFVPGTDYRLDGYNAELFDSEMNSLAKWYQEDYLYVKNGDEPGNVPTYMFSYDGRDLIDLNRPNGPENVLTESPLAGVQNVSAQTYLLRVTPVYKHKTGSIVLGAPGEVENSNSYPCLIVNPKVKAFRSGTVYRVDLDFDLDAVSMNGDRYKYEEPADFYTIEYSTDGGNTFQDVPGLNIHYNGFSWDGGSDDAIDCRLHRMHGDYRFDRKRHKQQEGIENIEQSIDTKMQSSNDNIGDAQIIRREDIEVDKLYANKANDENIGHLVADVDFWPCVATQVFTVPSMDDKDQPDFSQYVYRFTAHYATENPYIYQTSSVTEKPNVSPVPTGIDDVVAEIGGGDKLQAYPVPCESVLTVTCSSAMGNVSIYAANGALVKSVDAHGDNKVTIAVADLAAGNYVVRANGQALHIVKK